MSTPTEQSPTPGKAAVDITDGYIPCGDAVIDSSITAAIRDYYASLVNGKRAEYRQVDIKDRLAIACWGWGESSDPDIRERSRDLKTKELVRSMARIVLSGDPSQSKTKHISPLNEYWREVDDKFRNEIVEFTRRQNGVVIPHHLEFYGNSDNVFEPLAEIRDFRIYGKFLIRDDMYVHAEYLAQHQSLPPSSRLPQQD